MLRDPILYRNVEMEVRSVVNEEPPYVYANCYIQGYKYSLSVFIRQWNDCSAEEIEAIHSQLQDELYSFMCGIIDVIKMTEDPSPGRQESTESLPIESSSSPTPREEIISFAFNPSKKFLKACLILPFSNVYIVEGERKGAEYI